MTSRDPQRFCEAVRLDSLASCPVWLSVLLLLVVVTGSCTTSFKRPLLSVDVSVTVWLCVRKLHAKCGGLGGTTGSASDSRSEGRGFDSH